MIAANFLIILTFVFVSVLGAGLVGVVLTLFIEYSEAHEESQKHQRRNIKL